MAKRRRKTKRGCWCAIQRDSKGIRNMICSTSKRHTKNIARDTVKAHRGTPHGARFKIIRAAASNC